MLRDCQHLISDWTSIAVCCACGVASAAGPTNGAVDVDVDFGANVGLFSLFRGGE